MAKFPVFIALMTIAAFAAALFGAVHNQVSYTVGPTYFTEFKFFQFQIGAAIPDRLAAGYVGVMASWWMGPLIGLPAFIYGLIAVPTARRYFAGGMGAILIVILLATLGALAGLLGGLIADSTGLLDDVIAFPDGPTRQDLLRAGFMHDASYLAGALGLFAAFFPMRRARQDTTEKETSHAT